MALSTRSLLPAKAAPARPLPGPRGAPASGCLAGVASAWLVLLASLVFPGAAGAQTRILLLGDSITQGGQQHASYRYELWFDLLADAYDVDFVGQQTSINGGDPPNLAWYPDYLTTFDRDHEGYWGWRTDEIAGIALGAATATQPDVVLVHLGTNDVGQMGSGGVTNADTNLRLILQSIRSVRPQATFLLAQVIPIGAGNGYSPNAGQVAPLNAAIAAIASEESTPESPILLVDQNTGFDLGTMMQADGLHPNLLGEARMADVWRAALATVLTVGNPPPTVTLTAPTDGATFEAPANIALTADASDANGFVTGVDFHADGVLLGSDATSPYSFHWLGVPAGSHSLTALATDDGGATRTSAPVGVTVLPPGSAVPLAVANSSFEDPPLADGALSPGPGVVGSWLFEGTLNTFVGIFDPPVGSYPDAGGSGTPAGADGENVAYVFNDGGPAESMSASQVLADVLEADTRYTLAVAIGRFLPDQPYAFSTYGDYRIELRAGGSVIASDGGSVLPAFGEFRDAVASVASSTLDPALLGQPLSIRLELGTTEAPRSTHFDDVRLWREPEAASVPALGAWARALLATLLPLACLAGARRARRPRLSGPAAATSRSS